MKKSPKLTKLEFEKMEKLRARSDDMDSQRKANKALNQMVNLKKQNLDLQIKNLEIERYAINNVSRKLSEQQSKLNEDIEELRGVIRKRLGLTPESVIGYDPDSLELDTDNIFYIDEDGANPDEKTIEVNNGE